MGLLGFANLMEWPHLLALEGGVPNSVTYLNREPKFGWYVVSCAFKNSYQKKVRVPKRLECMFK